MDVSSWWAGTMPHGSTSFLYIALTLTLSPSRPWVTSELLVLVINAIWHGTGLSLQMLLDDISKRFPPLLNQVRMLQKMYGIVNSWVSHVQTCTTNRKLQWPRNKQHICCCWAFMRKCMHMRLCYFFSKAGRCQLCASKSSMRPFLQTQNRSRCSLPCLPDCSTWGSHPKVQCAGLLSALSASVRAQQIAERSHLDLWSVAPGSTHHTQQPSWSSASTVDTKLASGQPGMILCAKLTSKGVSLFCSSTKLACGRISDEELPAATEYSAACRCADCCIMPVMWNAMTSHHAQTEEHTAMSSSCYVWHNI